MRYFAIGILWALLITAVTPGVEAQQRATQAKQAIIMDGETGTVLFEKNADTPFPPASMSKLMTIYMAFDAIKAGELRLDDVIEVSDDAWRNWNNRGSTMFLGARDKVTVEQLLRGIIVLSGNDACVVLAEGMSGSEGAFVEYMNEKAQDIGLTGSVFKNSNGWPAEGHVMTVRDLARVSFLMATEFPDLYPMFAEREFLYKDFRSNRFNRNPLLGRFPGADGLKTGHTEESGYGLAGSASQDGRRIIMVIGGLESESARSRESSSLMQYAFRNFDTYPLLKAGETVDQMDIWLGDKPSVSLVVAEDVTLALSRRQRSNMEVSIEYVNPMPAPLTRGQKVGTLTVTVPDKSPEIFDLLAGESVGEVGGIGRIGAALEYLVFGSGTPVTPSESPQQ